MRESRISKATMRKYAHHRLRKHNEYMKNVPRHSIPFDHILNIVFKRTYTLLKDQVCKKKRSSTYMTCHKPYKIGEQNILRKVPAACQNESELSLLRT